MREHTENQRIDESRLIRSDVADNGRTSKERGCAHRIFSLLLICLLAGVVFSVDEQVFGSLKLNGE